MQWRSLICASGAVHALRVVLLLNLARSPTQQTTPHRTRICQPKHYAPMDPIADTKQTPEPTRANVHTILQELGARMNSNRLRTDADTSFREVP